MCCLCEKIKKNKYRYQTRLSLWGYTVFCFPVTCGTPVIDFNHVDEHRYGGEYPFHGENITVTQLEDCLPEY